MFLDVVLAFAKNKSTSNVGYDNPYFEWKMADFEPVALKWIELLLSFFDLKDTDAVYYIKRMYNSSCAEMYKQKVQV